MQIQCPIVKPSRLSGKRLVTVPFLYLLHNHNECTVPSIIMYGSLGAVLGADIVVSVGENMS